MTGEFRTFRNSDEEPAELLVDFPLKIPERRDSIWENTFDYLKKYATEQHEDLDIYPDIYGYTYGTIHLINFILFKQKEAPVKTLVFLDKSARLGAFLLRSFWTYLQEQGKITAETKLPKIRFINIGLTDYGEKDTLKTPQKMASEIFSSADIPKEGVLIVDEAIYSGRTAKKAQQFFKEKYGVKAQVLEQFTVLPEWYGDEDLLGITDKLIDEATYSFFENLSPADFKLVERLVVEFLKKEEKGILLGVVSYPELLSVDSASQQVVRQASAAGELLDKLEEYGGLFVGYDFSSQEIRKLFFLFADSGIEHRESIVNYITSKGGFLTKKTSSANFYKKAQAYRAVLKELARIASKRVWVDD